MSSVLSRLRSRLQRRADRSAWAYAFTLHPERAVHVGIRLRDGAYVYGPLASYNADSAETADRCLVLAGPVEIRTRSAETPVPYDADLVVVSDREIVSLSVHYLPKAGR